MPYTYLITHIPSNVKYYGVRYSKNSSPDDLGVSYFSSSKVIKKLIQTEGVQHFTFEVRKVFNTKEKAVEWEHKFLTKINAAQSEQWFNKHNGGSKILNKGGYKLDSYTRLKMKKPKSESHKIKLQIHLNKVRTVPEWSDERRKTQSEKMKGNEFRFKPGHTPKWSDERRKTQSEKMKGNNISKSPRMHKLVICPHCQISGRGGNMTRYHFNNCKM
jgi:hypothetical protein